jgi:hypothetical protein
MGIPTGLYLDFLSWLIILIDQAVQISSTLTALASLGGFY